MNAKNVILLLFLCILALPSKAIAVNEVNDSNPYADKLVLGSWTLRYADGVTICMRFSASGVFHDHRGFNALWSLDDSGLVIGKMVFNCIEEKDHLILHNDDVTLFLWPEPEAPVGIWNVKSSVIDEFTTLYVYDDGQYQIGTTISGAWYILDEAFIIEHGESTDAFYYELSGDSLVLLDWYTEQPVAYLVLVSGDYLKVNTKKR